MPVPTGRSRRKTALPAAPALTGAVLSLICAGWFATSSLAGYHEFAARSFTDAWDYQNRLLSIVNKSYTPKPDQAVIAKHHADQATQLAPWSADNHLTAGNVYLWEGMAPSDPLLPRNASLPLFREACRLSPARPDLWSRLARAKFLAGETDREFTLALQNAARLGPWRPSTIYDIVETGMVAWPRLEPEARIAVMQTITHSQTWQAAPSLSANHAHAIQNLIERYGRKAEICRMLAAPASTNHGFCPPLQPGQT